VKLSMGVGAFDPEPCLHVLLWSAVRQVLALFLEHIGSNRPTGSVGEIMLAGLHERYENSAVSDLLGPVTEGQVHFGESAERTAQWSARLSLLSRMHARLRRPKKEH